MEDCDLRHRIPRTLQLFADLILQVGRVADTIDQKIQEPLGWMLFDRGQREEAMECFNHALRADPENARAYLGVAKCYASRGKVQLAIENYTKAIKYEQDPQKKNDIMNKLYKEGGTWDT